VLITVALLTWASYLVGYADMGGRVVGAVPQGLPAFTMPLLDWHATVMLLPASFVIAVLSFMEAMSSAKVIAIKTRQPWDENRELIGQGVAKVAAAFCNSMPVSGSFSRSALNLAAGAQTAFSSVVTAACVLLTLLAFTSLLFHLPKPVLAAIIMMAVVGLINVRAMISAWRAGRDDGMAATATFVATLGFAPNIQNGIVTGVLLSLCLVLYRMMRPRVAELGLYHDGSLRDARVNRLPPLHARLGVIRFDGALRFVNVSYFEDELLRLARERPAVRYILVSSGGINALDASGVEMLSELVARFRGNSVTLGFSDVKKQVRDVMNRTGLTEIIGADNLFTNDRDALDKLYARGTIDVRVDLT
jgi:SulP family sulfate permease